MMRSGRRAVDGTDWGQALCPALDALLRWAELREGMVNKDEASHGE